MARITWLPREDSGPNSAISASTFNEISSSISFLYDQLEDIINLSGSVGFETKAARGGATNYITPIAVYDPNNINNFLDFSSGKFDFRGGDGDFRKSLHVRGDITASGVISASLGMIAQAITIPSSGALKIGDNSTVIGDNVIQTRTISTTDGNELTQFQSLTGEVIPNLFSGVNPGGTSIQLRNTDQLDSDGFSDTSNEIFFEIENSDTVHFKQDRVEFKGSEIYLFKENGDVDLTDGTESDSIIPRELAAHSNDKVLIYDAAAGAGGSGATGKLKFRYANTFISSLSSDFNGFETASIVGYDTNIVGGATTNLQFQFNSGLSGSIPDNNGPFNIGTSSLFTASQAISSSFATTTPFATTASFALNAVPTPTPTWNEVLTVGSDAAQNIYLNGNNRIVLGSTQEQNTANGLIFFNTDNDLQIESANGIYFNPSEKVGIGINTPTELLDINGNLRVRGTISASNIPSVTNENTVVLWNGYSLVSSEFSTLLEGNTTNAFATASFGTAGEFTASSSTSSFEFGFDSGLSGSIQNNILIIETSSLFVASQAVSSSYILADNIDQPFSNLSVTNDITASLISASAGITSSDVSINQWGSVSASLAAAVNSNDNLGHHTASLDLNLNGNDIYGVTNITASGIISSSGGFSGSLFGTATTASFVTLAQTASYVTLAQTASYVETAQTASYVENAQTASYIETAQTASYVETAQTASFVESASFALTASYVENSQTASYVETAQTASFVESASFALTSSYVETAQTASFVTGSDVIGIVTSASFATTASYIENAISASYVESASYIPNLQIVTDQGRSTTNAITSSGGLLITGSSKFKLLSQTDFIINNISTAASSEKFALVIDSSGVVKKAAAEFGAGSGASGNFIFHITASGTPSGPFSVIESGSIVLSGSQYIDVTAPSSGQLLFGVNPSLLSSISGAINAATESLATNVSALQNSASSGIFFRDDDSGFSIGLTETASFGATGGGGLTVDVNSTYPNVTYTLVGVLSSSQQIATDISGAINNATSSLLNTYTFLSSSQQIATDISGAVNNATSSILSDYGILSGSQQIATDITGAINAATSSILNDYGLVSGSIEPNQNAYSTASILGTNLELTATNITDDLVFEAGPNIFLTTGSVGTIYISASSLGSDNLGNHIATQTLEMGDGSNNFDINHVKDMTVHGDIKLQGENKISFDADNSNTYIAANSDNPEDIEIHADGDILLNPDNNVGIGIATTSPSEKLEVGGNVRGTTFISTGGSSATPSFRFSADTDTGLFLAQPGVLALQIGPSVAGEFSLREDQANFNVGVGVNGSITASSDISASGHLYASASHANGDYNNVVLYDVDSGRFYYTGSYGAGGSSLLTPETVLTQNNISSNTVTLGNIAVDASSSYVRAEFYARSGSVIQAARSVFVFSSSFSEITTTTTEDVRTHDTINLFNINTVSGSWNVDGNLVVQLRQYNNLTTDYKFRYVIM